MDSFFYDMKLKLTEAMQLIYYWALQVKVKDIKDALNISTKTIVKYFKVFRELCEKDLNLENFQIGSPGTTVEIDESLMAKVKHRRGKDLKRTQIWVFGLKERGNKRAVFIVVERRRAEDLLPLITKYVAPGSVIMSDCWAAYNDIIKHGYEHYQLNHSLNFVNPESIDKDFKIHTNGIESIWKDIKIGLKRMAGIKRGFIQSYLNEFMWRYMRCPSRVNTADEFIKIIRNFYPTEPGVIVADSLKLKLFHLN